MIGDRGIMNRYHFKVYTGPCIVAEVTEIPTAVAMPWQRVSAAGTKHAYLTVDALFLEAAERETQQLFTRAGFAMSGFRAQLIYAKNI